MNTAEANRARAQQRHVEVVLPRRAKVAMLRRAGYTPSEIAERLGVTDRTVARDIEAMGLPRRVNRPFTDDERARIIALLEDGASYGEVARTTGRWQQALRETFPGYAIRDQAEITARRLMSRQLNALMRETREAMAP